MLEFDDHMKELNRIASFSLYQAKELLEKAKRADEYFKKAGRFDLELAKIFHDKGQGPLAADYYISSGSAYLQIGDNDKAASIFRTTLGISNLPEDLRLNAQLLYDTSIAYHNYGQLDLIDKKAIEGIMGLLFRNLGYIRGRGTIMKIYHLVSRVLGEYGLPFLMTPISLSYSPIFYGEINDFIKDRETHALLERNRRNFLEPSEGFEKHILAEAICFTRRIESIDLVLMRRISKIIDDHGDFSIKDWDNFESTELDISRKSDFGRKEL